MSRMIAIATTALTCSLVWCVGQVVAVERAARLEALVGADMAGDMASGCVDCLPRSKTQGECDHVNNPPGTVPDTTACVANQCISNYLSWVECNPKPPSGTGDCKTHSDPSATWDLQSTYKPAAALNCGNAAEINGSTHAYPAGFPQGADKCTTATGIAGVAPTGKCFVTCGGTLLQTDPPRPPGGIVCGP